MPPRKRRRPVAAVVADMEDTGQAALEIVSRGKAAWDRDRLLRLAGEAVIVRIADAAGRLSKEVKAEIPNVPWEDIRDIRILVDHVYHRIDYEALWRTLREEVPRLLEELHRWKQEP
jgi:uncharacterized protein with HEPN domain